jgi:hypothetical protein
MKETEENQSFKLVKSDGSNGKPVGQWFLEKSSTPETIQFNIAPFHDYNIFIYPHLEKGSSFLEKEQNQKVTFSVEINWNHKKREEIIADATEEEIADLNLYDFDSLKQELVLSNNRIYENLY